MGGVRASDLHHLARVTREVALLATDNVGADRLNAGELAVLEDIALHPGAAISDVTRRTGLAQSLVSRIAHAMADAGVLHLAADPTDRRKVRTELDERIRDQITERAATTISDAVAACTPALTTTQRSELERHLSEADRLFRAGRPKNLRQCENLHP